MATITLQQALREMDRIDERGRPVPFHIEFVTCDEKRGTGGELLSYPAAVLARSVRRAKAATSSTSSTAGPRAGSEWRNQVRNVSAVDTDEIRKLSIRLITQFNFQTIVW